MMDNLKNIDYEKSTELLAIFSKALSHPTRIKILKHIEHCSGCFPNEIMEKLPLAQSTISRHIKILKNAGLIKAEKIHPNIKYHVNVSNWQIAKALFNNLLR
jgi:DNA-binding transcriptional ArsR family regulator